jgi:ribosomal protein L37AE/L43A
MTIELYDCKPDCDVSKAELVSRAKWVCPKCGRDISLQYLMWHQAMYPEEWSEP